MVRVYGLESDIKQVQGAACHAHGCSGIREVTAESAEGETPTHVFHVYLHVADCACESVIRCVHSAHRRVWDALSVRLPHAVMEFDIGNIKQSESSA